MKKGGQKYVIVVKVAMEKTKYAVSDECDGNRRMQREVLVGIRYAGNLWVHASFISRKTSGLS
jgi:hypothetical protein